MVLTFAGAQGFEKAPTCQALALGTAAATLGSWMADSRGIRVRATALLVCKRSLALASVNQAVAAFVLLYSARALERQWGTGKFAAFMLYTSACVAAAHSVSARQLPQLAWATGPSALILSVVPALFTSASMVGGTVMGMPSPWWAVSAALQVCSCSDLACVSLHLHAQPHCNPRA